MENYWSLLEEIPIGIILLDDRGVVLLCNRAAVNNFSSLGHGPLQAGQTLRFYLEEHGDIVELLAALESSKIPSFEVPELSIGKDTFMISGKRVDAGILLSMERITDLKIQEKESINLMLEGQEAERQRLAREIHDGVGPLLSTIKLYLDELSTNWQSPDESLSKIKAISSLLKEVTHDLRQISHALIPGALLDLGLVAALHNLAQRANKSGRIRVDFYHSGIEKKLEESLALGIYRIIQELLQNVFKHAQAKNVNIQLIRHAKSILLMVEDDGVGFDKEQLEALMSKGIGLRNIQTRAEALNGVIILDTQPGHGLVTTVEIPL